MKRVAIVATLCSLSLMVGWFAHERFASKLTMKAVELRWPLQYALDTRECVPITSFTDGGKACREEVARVKADPQKYINYEKQYIRNYADEFVRTENVVYVDLGMCDPRRVIPAESVKDWCVLDLIDADGKKTGYWLDFTGNDGRVNVRAITPY